MKARKAVDLRNLSDEELASALADAQETLTNLNFQLAIGELENKAYIKTLRHDIARINTILRERELNISR